MMKKNNLMIARSVLWHLLMAGHSASSSGSMGQAFKCAMASAWIRPAG